MKIGRAARSSAPPGGEKQNQNQPAIAGEMRHTARTWLISLALLAVLTLAMFGDVLFTSKDTVLSNRGTDLTLQFIHWRTFGFGELKRGHLALWNPHLFSGAPFFGGFQSALLYPPNGLFLVLPLAKAINWSIALHVFLAGAFTYGWAARRALHPLACFLSAAVFMFCGAYFPHIYAGHLPNLCTMVWAPLLFLAIDGLFETPSLGWSLLGMFAMAMQVLAGHPQYVFYTGVAAVIYCVLHLFKTVDRKRFVLGLAGIVVGGVALSAVQLFTGLQESCEMLRSVALPYDFAAMFSFPPENFLTLLAPNLFGDLKTLPYWGRCYLWEMSLFMGVSAFVLAVVGAACGDRRVRRFSVVMIGLLFLLALGTHTPLFELFYYCVPGFNEFRGNSKFTFLASLFLAMLAGIGCNELLKGRRPPRSVVWGAGIAGFLLIATAASVRQSNSGTLTENWWHSVMLAVRGTGETDLSPKIYEDLAFTLQAADMASQSFLIAGVTLIIVAALLLCVRRYRPAVWLLLALAAGELFVFAHKSLDTFVPGRASDPGLKQFLEAHPGDYRILNPTSPNSALSLGAQEIWGYDPGVTLRYAQLLAFTQDNDLESVTQFMPFRRHHPLLAMLRCRFMFVPQRNQVTVYEHTNYLPHLLLVQRCHVLSTRAEIFAALASATFDPREEVILESEPDVQPKNAGEAGTASIINSSTDSLTIHANVKTSSILLLTDTYAKGWRARALPGSSQQRYQIMPANYCLRAIPLAAGEHRLRVEYLPSGFLVGRWISLIALLVFGGLVANCCWRRCFSPRPAGSTGGDDKAVPFQGTASARLNDDK